MVAKDHAILVRPCASNSRMCALEADAIASSSGTCGKARCALDHAILERSREGVESSGQLRIEVKTAEMVVAR